MKNIHIPTSYNMVNKFIEREGFKVANIIFVIYQIKYMLPITIYFDEPRLFDPSNINPLIGIAGLYFIFSKSISIQYPFDKSRLLYIGMSERKTNSISSRLSGHFGGKSKNVGLLNYRKTEPLYFTYINFEMLRNNWSHRIEDLESYFILNFVEHFGVYPICNNKTGAEVLDKTKSAPFKIDWNYFK